MPDDPFSPDQRGRLAAALEAMEGTEGEEQVVITPSGGGRSTFDVAHIDDQFAVYVEWADDLGFEDLALPMPADPTVYDTRGRTATIGLGEVDAATVVELLAAWAPIVFGDEPLSWSSSADDEVR